MNGLFSAVSLVVRFNSISCLVRSMGAGKGGAVQKRITAVFYLERIDARLQGCEPRARYSFFVKEGVPDKIDIRVSELPIAVGEVLDVFINGVLLGSMKVRESKRARIKHWADEGVEFPVLKVGDELMIKYQNATVLEGVFELEFDKT